MKKQNTTILIVGVAALAGIYLITKNKKNPFKQEPYQAPAPSPQGASTQTKVQKGLDIAKNLLNLFNQIKSSLPAKGSSGGQTSAGSGYNSNGSNVAGISIY